MRTVHVLAFVPAVKEAEPAPLAVVPPERVVLHDLATGELVTGLRDAILHVALMIRPSTRALTGLTFRELRRFTAGQPVTIHGDGSQRRDLTHVSDVARAVALAIHWQQPGQHIFNIGTGRSQSVHDMLDFVANFTGFTPEVRYQLPHPADVPETLANPSKARVLLGWEPLVFFPDPP